MRPKSIFGAFSDSDSFLELLCTSVIILRFSVILMWRGITVVFILGLARARWWLLVGMLYLMLCLWGDNGSTYSFLNLMKLEHYSIVVWYFVRNIVGGWALRQSGRLFLRLLSNVLAMVLLNRLLFGVLTGMSNNRFAKLRASPWFIGNMVGGFGLVLIIHFLNTHPTHLIIEYKRRFLYSEYIWFQ